MSRPGAKWFAVHADVPEFLEDELASALGLTGLGVEIAPLEAGKSRLRAYFSVADAAALAESAVLRALAAHGLDSTDCQLRTDLVEDGRWVERYQASLRPFVLGERFVVVPGGEPAAGERVPIRLVPGMAFGTGEHPTTRLCVAALEAEVEPGSVWIDVGCGTGILAIAAVRLGAERVEAFDVDPEAVGVAREVVAANGVGERVTVRLGSVGGDRLAAVDGMVANIAASFFLERAGDLAASLREGGRLVAAGFLEEDRMEIEHALARAGLHPERRASEEPWALVVARR